MTIKMALLRDMWTTVDGIPMYARVALNAAPKGSPTIILIHGFLISSRYMAPLARHLAPHFRVYAPDLPGFGNSGDPGRVLTIPELADSTARWMDAVRIDRAILLGNSMGCQVIAHFGTRHPDRLNAAILVGPTVEPGARTVAQQAFRLLLDAPRERPSLWAAHIPDYFNAGLRRILRMMTHVLEDRIELLLPGVQAPTLIVRGAHDPIVSQEWAERMAALLPHGHLLVMPEAAHVPNYSQPDRLAAIVRAFVGMQQGIARVESNSTRWAA